MLEQVRGESDIHCTAVVKILEELCEAIYSSYESASKGDKDSFLPIDAILKELENSIDEHILNRKEILLLSASESSREVLMPIYNKYSSDSSYDVVVMDLPLMLKDYYGNITGYGADSQCTYDISLHCPDAIYFQNPYDKENPCLTIPPEFYTENLRKYSDKLVFVPIGTISDFTDNTSVDSAVMKYYVSSPGVIMADEVWVQSETLKQRYVDRLALFAGEDTRSIWEKKISSRPELFSINCSKESPMGAASLQSTKDSVKNLLICIAAYEPYEHADDYESSLSARFDLLKEYADKIHVSVCVYPNDSIDKVTSGLLDKFGLNLIRYPSTSLNVFCQKFDAYYGSACPLVPVFADLKKPVMIADLGI